MSRDNKITIASNRASLDTKDSELPSPAFPTLSNFVVDVVNCCDNVLDIVTSKSDCTTAFAVGMGGSVSEDVGSEVDGAIEGALVVLVMVSSAVGAWVGLSVVGDMLGGVLGSVLGNDVGDRVGEAEGCDVLGI